MDGDSGFHLSLVNSGIKKSTEKTSGKKPTPRRRQKGDPSQAIFPYANGSIEEQDGAHISNVDSAVLTLGNGKLRGFE